MYETYILECSDGTFYVGAAPDARRRVETHLKGGGALHTRVRLPVKLVYVERFEKRENALRRESQIKGWSRAKKIALIEGDLERLRVLSKSKKGRERK